MAKSILKPMTALYPLPAVMVTCGHTDQSHNIITIAWTGTASSEPPMAYISVRPHRHSFNILKETGDFVINVPAANQVYELDYCGTFSGKDVDKFKVLNLTKEESQKVKSPSIKECPVNIECVVNRVIDLGAHHMFLADVVSVSVDDSFKSDSGNLKYDALNTISYINSKYYTVDKNIGYYGYSASKK